MFCVSFFFVWGGPRQSWALPFVFWTVTYGPNRGFTLITGLPLGLSLSPIKGRDALAGKTEKLFSFSETLNQGFSV